MTRKPTAYILLLVTACALLAGCSPDGSYMRQRLQYVSDCNRAETVFTARWLPTVDTLVGYFDRHGSANDRMMAHYLKGRVHHDMGESPQALECYQRAAEQADTASADCDFRQLSRIYAQTARLFLRQNMPTNALVELSFSRRFALKSLDSVTYISSYVQSSMANYELQHYSEAMQQAKKAYALHLEAKDTVMAYLALRQAILSALRADSLDAAGMWLLKYENESGLLDDRFEALPGHEVYYSLKGKHLVKTGNYQGAEQFFRRHQAHSVDIDSRVWIYQGLYEVYKGMGNRDSIAKYSVLYSQYNDSSTMALRSRELQEQESLYNFTHSSEVAARMAERAHQSEKVIYMTVFLLTVLVLLVSAILFIYYYRVKSRIRNANLAYFSLLMRYLREQMKLQLLMDEGHQNQSEIEIQQNVVNNLKKQMSFFRENPSGAWNVDEMFLGNQAVVYFHELAALGKRPTGRDWQKMRQCMNEFLPGFIDSVGQRANIGIHETNVCILVKLFFTPSEICSLLDIRPQALTNMRTRLLWKLFGRRGGARDFDEQIRHLNPEKS